MNHHLRISTAVAVSVGILAGIGAATVRGQTAASRGPAKTQPPASTGRLSEEQIQQYVNKYEYYLRQLDTNHNGFLEQPELEGRGGVLAARMAQKAGVELALPMPIHRIREGLLRRLRSPGTGASPSTAAGGTPSGPPASAPAPGDSAGESPGAKVPGFGVERDETSVPGFGGATGSDGSSPPSKSSSSRSRSSGSSSSSSSGERVDYRIRRYAQSLLKQYDKNGNGKLEKEEWSRMRGDPKEADRNKDGIVTLDELTRRLADYSRSRQKGSGSSHSSDSSSRDSSSSDSRRSHYHRSRSSDEEKSKGYRFLTPTERLPEGLPSWFTQRDADGDGQVSMAEYSQSWTKSKAAEFTKLDPNGDGVITPAECLRGEDSK